MTVSNVPDLSQWDETYQQTQAYENEYPDVPDGTYHCIVEKLELTTSQSGNPMLKWTLGIVDDVTHTGRKLFRNNMIVSPENLRWLKTDLERAGLEIVRVSELQNPEVRGRLIGAKIKVQKKTKELNGEIFENIYVQKRLDPSVATGQQLGPSMNMGAQTQPGGYPQQPHAQVGYPPQQPMQQPSQQYSQPASNLPRF